MWLEFIQHKQPVRPLNERSVIIDSRVNSLFDLQPSPEGNTAPLYSAAHGRLSSCCFSPDRWRSTSGHNLNNVWGFEACTATSAWTTRSGHHDSQSTRPFIGLSTFVSAVYYQSLLLFHTHTHTHRTCSESFEVQFNSTYPFQNCATARIARGRVIMLQIYNTWKGRREDSPASQEAPRKKTWIRRRLLNVSS